MRGFAGIFLLSVCAWAQDPQLTSSKAFYAQIKDDILKSVDKLPEDKYSFKPSPDVRTYGQLLAHVADAQYIFCGTVQEGKAQFKGLEKSATTKPQILAALKDGFAYCDATYAGLTDATSADTVSWFGQKRTKLSVLDFNIAHAFEHYGNLVTYMRINGVTPPSSDPKR
jgi:uncharacterized damage-inducible protein DinB